MELELGTGTLTMMNRETGEDRLKTIMKAKYGAFNPETGECDIEVESIEYIFKPYQLQREVRK